MEGIYREYLEWFKKNAVSGVNPVGMDRMLESLIMVDEYDDEIIRAYYILFVRPSECHAGKAEFFIIEEESTPCFDSDGNIMALHNTRYNTYIMSSPCG